MNTLTLRFPTRTAFIAAVFCAVTPVNASEFGPVEVRADYLVEHPVRRMSLVIGNRNYINRSVETVVNANNDAREVARRFASIGFDTVLREDVELGEMYQELQHLESRVHQSLEQEGVRPFVAIYYSGHGFNLKGRGYLTGSDIDPRDPVSASLAIETILLKLARESVVVLFVDACRADATRQGQPPAGVLPLNSAGSAEKWKGIGINSADGDAGPRPDHAWDPGMRKWKAVVWYAALRLGGLASMGASKESTLSAFTEAFVDVVAMQGLELSQEYRRLETNLIRLTAGRQEPDQSGHVGYVYMLWLNQTDDEIRSRWQRTLRSGGADEIFAFLDDYPESQFTSAATRWLRDRGRAPP